MLERDQSNHDDFVNIKPSGKCGVCLANGLESYKARNGSYGCFSCNVRVCWHPDCLRDHLAIESVERCPSRFRSTPLVFLWLGSIVRRTESNGAVRRLSQRSGSEQGPTRATVRAC